MQAMGAALEHCPTCNALLDVSGCSPLTETFCPSCGSMIKVLKEFHHFSLMNILGRGGAGTVYRAFDHTLERDVALKLLRQEHTHDPAYVESLEREALITASISHPNVVKVYATDYKHGSYFVAMELVTGGSLAEKIELRGRLTESEVLKIGIQLTQGLQAAWDRGLLHRDVKPGNILFANQEVKVSDFGLALPLEQTRKGSGDIWGTPEYIAPEKLLGAGEDVRSDIYSVGCTLYHCLTGTSPVETRAVMAALKTGVLPKVPNVRLLAPETSDTTTAVIRRCVQDKPGDRFAGYDELLASLSAAQSRLQTAQRGRSSAAQKQPPTSASAGGNKNRVPVMAIATAIGCMAGVALGIFFWSKTGSTSPTGSAAKPMVSTIPQQASTPGASQDDKKAAIPLSWAAADVGTAASTPGAFSQVDGKFVVAGSGIDIWNREDGFRFVHLPVNGDCALTARVIALEDTSPYAKAGVMFREGLSTGAAHVMVDVTPSRGVEFIFRAGTDGITFATPQTGPKAPYWIRIERKANVFTGYSSPDGIKWTQTGTPEIVAIPSTAYVGLVTCSHNNGMLCTASFDNVSLQER